MAQKTYYKIIGKNYGNFPYREGVINSLTDNGELFNPDPECGPGGLYFCEIKHIFCWLKHGNKVCEITLPEDARIVQIGNKFKADKIKIERIFDFDFDFGYLIEKGADIHVENDIALRLSAYYGRLNYVKYLVENGALRWATCRGHLDVIKYLVENGADMHALDNAALHFAILHKYLNIVKYFVENGANVRSCVSEVLFLAVGENDLDLVRFLLENNLNCCKTIYHRSIKRAACNGHTEIVKYLMESINIDIDIDYLIALAYHYPETVEYLQSKVCL